MRRAVLALPLSLLLLTPAYAANAADPPSRVGRLSYIDGTVSFHPAGQQGDWLPATVNYPVTTGESFWSDANARGTIEIGPAELRLDQATELDVTRLDDRSTDLQLDQGVLNLHFAQMPSGEITITTPRGRVLITAPGDYDIDAGQPDNDQPSDQLQVSVFSGAAKFESDRGAVDIPAGQAAAISGDPLDVQLVAASPNDFDQWAQDQEHKEDLAKIPQAVPPAVTGYQDLAAYGSWSDAPDYGQVWYPSDVPADWAPYRDGHWAWVDPWGWTWIDDAPWGFAPFHYGRWVEVDDRWAWVPGDIPPQPVYAPALVAFVGGDGWGVDLAAGAAVAAIGWVALAPHESYHPWYRASSGYDRSVNGRDWNPRNFNATNVTVNNFRNRQATTVVPTAAFTHAAPVQRASVTVAADQLAHTRASRTATANLQPSAFSRAGRADPQAATAATPHANAQANVAHGRVAATTPAALAQQKAPTAPGPHRVAEAAHPIHANAPANAAASPNTTQQQRNAAAANNAEHPNATANAAPQATEAPNAPRGPAPIWGRGEHANAPAAPAANANLAAHPAPPTQATREAPHSAPNQPAREAAQAAPNAPAPTVPAGRDLAAHPAPPQTAAQSRAEHAGPEHAAAPNAAPHAEIAQPQHAPAAPPPSHQTAALPPEAPRHAPAPAQPPAAPPAHAAAPAPHPAPQIAHAPAPMPPHLAPPPHAAAPAPVPHPAAAPAPHPPAAPHPAPAPAPHPAAAPAPHPPAPPHPAAASAPHPAAAPAPHPAPAPAAHPAPAKAAPAPDKKDQPPH